MSNDNRRRPFGQPSKSLAAWCLAAALVGTLPGCDPAMEPTLDQPSEIIQSERIEPVSPALWAAVREQSPFPIGDVKLFGVLDRDQTDTERRVVYFVGEEQVEYTFGLNQGWRLERRVGVRGTRPTTDRSDGPALTSLPGYPHSIARVWDEYGFAIQPQCTDPGITGSGQYQCPGWTNYGTSNPRIGHGTFLIDTLVVGGWQYRFELGPFTYWNFFGSNGLDRCTTVSCSFNRATDVYFSFYVVVSEHTPPPPTSVWISQGPTHIGVTGRYTWEMDSNKPVYYSSWNYRVLGTSTWGPPPPGLGPEVHHARLSLGFPIGSNPSFQLRAMYDRVWSDPYTVTVVNPLPPPPLSLAISGDDEVGPQERCAWQAVVSGGYPPYSYNWWGGLTGSTRSIIGGLRRSSYLWVRVTDARSESRTAQILVEVDEGFTCDF